MTRFKHIFFIYLLLSATLSARAAQPDSTATKRPRMIVNIVIGAMQAGDLERYADNFGYGGFRRLAESGTTFTECYTGYAPSTTSAALATIATGTTPDTHALSTSVWYDRSTNRPIYLCSRNVERGSEWASACVSREFTDEHFISGTLSDAVMSNSQKAKAITIAHNAHSAMLLSGRSGECYWMGADGNWCSSDCHTAYLPSWVRAYNDDGLNTVFVTGQWYGKYPKALYTNTLATDIVLYEGNARNKGAVRPRKNTNLDNELHATPAANVAIFEFAKRAVASLLPTNINDGCRLLNICIDSTRHVAEKYGPESVEYEDMLYCLDSDLAEFLTYLYAQVKDSNEIAVVLTSDHGTSPSFNRGTRIADRFNTAQFEVIVNAFLSARYGQDSWVLGMHDGSLFLNHDTIYKHKLSVYDIQTETATFAMQFRGVAHALTATALSQNYFGRGVAAAMQRGFNPRRSGDIMICFMPGVIAECDDTLSLSGSPYNYDCHIPLIICGGCWAKGASTSKRVEQASIAPTEAMMLGIARPDTSDAKVIELTK